MGESNKSNVLRGITSDPKNKLVVQKSKPLDALWKSDFDLNDLKIIDMYMARINSHDPETKIFIMTKKEYEELMGISRLRVPEFRKRLERFLAHAITIYDEENDVSKAITLFQSADIYKNEKGEYEIKLMCTPVAEEYIFNIENLGYIKYKLDCILGMTSRKSYVLFSYLKRCEYEIGNTWMARLDDIREMLIQSCTGSEEKGYYDEYKRFNSKVLLPCKEEIEAKAGFYFDYKPIRGGKSYKYIKFTIPEHEEENPNIIEGEAKETGEVKHYTSNRKGITSAKEAWKTPLSPLGFNEGQLSEIEMLLMALPQESLPAAKNVRRDNFNYLNLQRFEYMKLKKQRLDVAIKNNDEQIKWVSKDGMRMADTFSWLIGQIKEDLTQVESFPTDYWKKDVERFGFDEKQMANLKDAIEKVPLYKLPDIVQAAEDRPGITALARHCFMSKIIDSEVENETTIYKKYCHIMRNIREYQKDDGKVPHWKS